MMLPQGFRTMLKDGQQAPMGSPVFIWTTRFPTTIHTYPDHQLLAYAWPASGLNSAERYRQAITLTEYDGLSQRGISEQLGMSLSGAKSRIQRARGKLKDMLLECCHFEFDRLGHIIDYQSKEPSCRYCPISCSEG